MMVMKPLLLLGQARTAQKPYDIIFMDMQMPKMDGITATQIIIEAHQDSTDCPWIIAMTANAMAEDKVACLQAGMKSYVVKPVKVEKIELALADYFAAKS